MTRTLPACLLVVLLPAAPAAAFPGDQVFTGKVGCITFYNSGTSGPVPITDIVTLSFTASFTETNEQEGTVLISHTETSASGLQLDDVDPLSYRAFTNPEDSNVGLVAIHEDGSGVRGAIAEFKRKRDGSVSSLRFVSSYSDDSTTAQRCSGTLKRVPVS
jgi:hypothetical protein